MNTKTYYQYRSDKDTFNSTLSPETMKLIYYGCISILDVFGISGRRAITQVYRAFPVCIAVFKVASRASATEATGLARAAGATKPPPIPELKLGPNIPHAIKHE